MAYPNKHKRSLLQTLINLQQQIWSGMNLYMFYSPKNLKNLKMGMSKPEKKLSTNIWHTSVNHKGMTTVSINA